MHRGNQEFVDDRLQFVNGWDTRAIDRDTEFQIKAQIKNKLFAQSPVLASMTEIKIVANPRRNFINVRVLRDYQTLLYFEEYEADYFCFFLSDKFEPFMIITVVSGKTGERLVTISSQQVTFLFQAIGRFKEKYGIQGESYHYTSMDERLETHAGAGSMHMKSHSKNFHVKMRISKGMLQERMPINRLLKVEKLCVELEPIQYAFTRKTVTLETLRGALMQEIKDSEIPASYPSSSFASAPPSSSTVSSTPTSSGLLKRRKREAAQDKIKSEEADKIKSEDKVKSEDV
jgi:hypothetical protein